MNIYKHGKAMAVSAVMLLGLAACNTNDEAMDMRDNRMTTLGNNQESYWDNDANRIKQQRRRAEINSAKRNTNDKGFNQKGRNTTSEIMQTPDGYITIDPNSYSTGIPSSKFPHTQMNGQGRLTLTEGQRADLDQMLAELQRRSGVELPQLNRGGIPAPEQGAAPAPQERATPAPEQGAIPAPQERATPAPEQGAAPAPQERATPAPEPEVAPAPQERATPAPEPEAAPAPQERATPAPEPEAAPAPQERTAPAPQEEAAPAPEQKATPSGTELSAFEAKVIDLTNEQRRKNGLQNLQPDTALSNVAQEKSNDMQAKNYFSHTSPTYGSPFDMMRDFGVSYNTAGENIAMGQQSAEEVVNAWMNSEGHRKNILSPNYTHIGVGHTTQGNYWTQMFIGK
ncbi:CAP domain-containing protein [Mesobacillus jeotgali]|uniref:CAP domain-containing protein n=1 Tax=Mesobacillus jeotgali TaxID=129985 RepID=A0ABY9VKT3_9BACI|nr:CAP domain-containing protein [Mesobacillus jeotgali]WNF24158.1 CAP domain-containing protein [Mesobacillus jeotgali]